MTFENLSKIYEKYLMTKKAKGFSLLLKCKISEDSIAKYLTINFVDMGIPQNFFHALRNKPPRDRVICFLEVVYYNDVILSCLVVLSEPEVSKENQVLTFSQSGNRNNNRHEST
jgi:hypothetical protein